MKRPSARGLGLTLLLCALAMVLVLHPTTTFSAAPPGIRDAWERARRAGAYHFSADIVQTAIPLPTVTNVGRQSRQDSLHVEGRANLAGATLDLTIWSQGGSLLRAADGLQVRVEEGGAVFLIAGERRLKAAEAAGLTEVPALFIHDDRPQEIALIERRLAGLREALIARGGRHAEALARNRTVRCALNQAMVDESSALTPGAEVAFFPPVTGG